jgi:hypothetical protein
MIAPFSEKSTRFSLDFERKRFSLPQGPQGQEPSWRAGVPPLQRRRRVVHVARHLIHRSRTGGPGISRLSSMTGGRNPIRNLSECVLFTGRFAAFGYNPVPVPACPDRSSFIRRAVPRRLRSAPRPHNGCRRRRSLRCPQSARRSRVTSGQRRASADSSVTTSTSGHLSLVSSRVVPPGPVKRSLKRSGNGACVH